jgi:endonuclease-3
VKLPPRKDRVPELLRRFVVAYPETGTALHFESPFQLLVATILSAQCTDVRVNIVTPPLFARFPDAAAFAAATQDQVEALVKTTGFFRNKAKNIRAAATMILTEFGGQVPGTLDELVRIPGVGRKTANVVLGDAFGVTGITVDTHVGRLSRRLGLTRKRDPVKVEMVLNKLIPRTEWTRFSHRLILHGRQVCSARKPNCGGCPLADVCPKIGVRLPAEVAGKPGDGVAGTGQPS